DASVLRHDRLVAVTCQRLDAGADPADARRPDEDHLHRRGVAVEHRAALRLERLALAAVGVALDADVDEAERELSGILHVAREENEPGAGAEERPTLRMEFLERDDKPPLVHELEQRGALTAGDDEAVDTRQLLGLADLDSLDATPRERFGVPVEVALEREHADPHDVCRHGLPAACLHQVLFGELGSLDAGHRLAEILADADEYSGILEVGGRLHDGLRALGRIRRLEDAGAHE